MKTQVFRIRDSDPSSWAKEIEACAAILRSGGLVAMPTETVYGLAANALSAEAVSRIFEAKGRPAWDPLIVHIADLAMIEQVVAEFPNLARELANRFWPGPLTVLLPRATDLPLAVTAGRETVAVRMPGHPVARALIRAAGMPLAAPSANPFGKTSPTTAEHVLRDLDGRIDAVLDAGATTVGVESAVLDPLRTPPLLLRPGGITREQIEQVIGPIELYSAPAQAAPEALASPGLAVRHYAPEAELMLVNGTREALLAAVAEEVSRAAKIGAYVGVMAPDTWIDVETLSRGGLVIFDWGTWGDWSLLAQNLFAGIRFLDKPGVGVILCPMPPDEGLGTAIRDRLSRAARKQA